MIPATTTVNPQLSDPFPLSPDIPPNPHNYFIPPHILPLTLRHFTNNDLRSAVQTAFHISPEDTYIYHAHASITLSQAQSAIAAGTANGLCDWYLDSSKTSLGHPPTADITAYTSIFLPKSSPHAALTSLRANAKKDSLRSGIATHLCSKYFLHASLAPPKSKKKKVLADKDILFNPYLIVWLWSCNALRWAGPTPSTADLKTTHPILPIFMHHFGCVVPTQEVAGILRSICLNNGTPIADIGSGTGYWTYFLRAAGLKVHAIDNAQSAFRCIWISNTIKQDGETWLKSNKGAPDIVLLLVYPITSGNFVEKMVNAYKGQWVCVAGTQSRSGYTAFKDRDLVEWMEGKDWSRRAQIPLPSFAGKDEAFFLFQRSDGYSEQA